MLGHTSLAQLSAWQDYASRQLFIQQISIPLTATNNVRVLPGCTRIISLVLKPSKTSFVLCLTIIGKGITYVKPLDPTLPLRLVEIEFENNISIMVMMESTRQGNMVHHVHYAAAVIALPNIASKESMTSMILWKRWCCLEVCNTSDCTIEFQYGQDITYFNARSKGLVQINNSKHFPIDQYLHDRVTPATLGPKPIACDKPIAPAEMPCISTCTEMTTEDTNVPTEDDKYLWLDPDDK